ncbi:MAG: type II toxin-antitoxin system VapB family antitoxin [SAR324 cluster bacterium]|nr:type II toxin-antitoxin system VapB family antitoxin [SAR324 cluster bacterium]
MIKQAHSFQKMDDMRITINIGDHVMEEVMAVSHSQTKTAAVNEALKDWVRLQKLQRLRELRGRLNWEGDLRELRNLEMDTEYDEGLKRLPISLT